jgi:WD40 repeat protein
MAEPTRLTKWDKIFKVDDGANRGPMTMSRVAFHPTARRLLASCADRRLAAWDVDRQAEKVKSGTFVMGEFVCPHELGWIRGFDVHPAGREVATGGSDRRLKIWAWTDDGPSAEPRQDAPAHDGWVEAVAYSPDGRMLATAGADRLVKVWSAAELSAPRILTGHANYLRDLAWSPDGRLLVSGGEDGRLLVWDASTGELARSIDFGGANNQFGQNPSLGGVHRLAISHDGRFVAAAGGQRVAVFDLGSGEILAADKLETQIAFSPAGAVLAAGSNSVKVMTYEAEKLQPLKPDAKGNVPAPPAVPGKELAVLKIGDFAVGLGYSRDGKLLGLGRADGTVEVWELA